MIYSFDHIFLLGWWDKNGVINLTKWSGIGKWIDVAVVNATDADMGSVMWDGYIPNYLKLLPWPDKGIHAFGWYVENKIVRKSTPPTDGWEWLRKIKNNV